MTEVATATIALPLPMQASDGATVWTALIRRLPNGDLFVCVPVEFGADPEGDDQAWLAETFDCVRGREFAQALQLREQPVGRA